MLVKLRRNITNMQKLVVGTEGLHRDVCPFCIPHWSPFSFLSSQFQKLFSMFLSQHFINLLKRLTEVFNQAFQLSSGFLTFCHVGTCKSINFRVFRFIFWCGNRILEKEIQDTVWGSWASSSSKFLKLRSPQNVMKLHTALMVILI